MRKFVLLACLALPLPAVAQDDDKGYLTNLLEENLSGAGRSVVIDGFAGALSSQASLTRMTIADSQGVWLTLKDVTLDWSRSSLLVGKVQVSELTAGEIILDRQPIAEASTVPAPEASGFSLPELPVSVIIDKLSAAKIVLGAPILGTPLEARLEASVALSGGEGSANLVLERTDEGPAERIALTASYANESGQLAIDLDVQEGAGGLATQKLGIPGAPAVDLTVKGEGPVSGFIADVSLSTDNAPRLAGTVELKQAQNGAQGFDVDLSGDLAPLFAPEYAEFFGNDVSLKATGEQATDGRLLLNQLALRARTLILDGTLALAADGLPQSFALTGSIGSPDGSPVLLPLTTDLKTELNRAEINLSFDAATGDGWVGHATVNGLRRDDFSASQLQLNGSGVISRLANQQAASGTIAFNAEGLSPRDAALGRALGSIVGGEADFKWTSGIDGLELPRIVLFGEDYGLNAALRLVGISTGLTVSGEASVQAANISRAAALADRPLSGALKARVQGAANVLGGSFDLQGSVDGTNLVIGQEQADNLLKGGSHIDISIKRDQAGTVLRLLNIEAQTLKATAQGTIATAGNDITADINFSDLSALGPDYRGALSGKATFKGMPEAGDVTLKASGNGVALGIAELDGLLQGPSTIALDANISGQRITLRRADVAAATLRVGATGVYDPAGSDLAADVAFADLSVLGAAYKGALNGKATFKGKADDGDLTLNANGTSVSVGIPQVDGLLRGASIIVLDAGLKGQAIMLRTARVNAQTLNVTASGTYDPAGSDIAADVSFGDLRALGGGYRGALAVKGSFAGTPEKGTLNVTGNASNLAIGQPEADALLRGQTNLSAALRLDGGRIAVDRATLQNPQLTVDASGEVAGATRRVTLSARLANLALVLPGFPGAVTVDGTAVDNGQVYQVNLSGRGPGQIDARVAGSVDTNFGSANLTITGSAQSGLINAFLGPRSISGPVRFDLALNGPLAPSSLIGTVTLSGGRFADPSLPFSLDAIAATANLGGGQARVDATTNVSSGGQVRVAGTVGLAAPYDANLQAELTRVVVKDPALYQTRLAGTISVEGPLTGGALIGGRVDLVETEVRIPETGLGGVGSLPDLQHINEPAAVRATRVRAGLLDDGSAAGGGASQRPFGIDLLISAPNRIFVRGRGLDAELGGQLRLSGTTANIVPSGSFNLIRGRLDILGKRIDLVTASLQLEGDFNALIDVLASTESDGITSSVKISGSAFEPKVSFVSSPELPEEEVLSRLLFGRDLTSLSAFQAAQLASAVASLAGRGGDGIVGRLRKGFGLDNLDVSTSDSGAATVRAGKYLSRNLYTEVEVDDQGQSQINLNLDVTPNITLRGSAGSSGDTGIGIFLERDY